MHSARISTKKIKLFQNRAKIGGEASTTMIQIKCIKKQNQMNAEKWICSSCPIKTIFEVV